MSKEYHKNYYNTHKEIWTTKIKCDICNGEYSNSSKYRHLKSKKHLLCEQQKKINELENKINTIKENLK